MFLGNPGRFGALWLGRSWSAIRWVRTKTPLLIRLFTSVLSEEGNRGISWPILVHDLAEVASVRRVHLVAVKATHLKPEVSKQPVIHAISETLTAPSPEPVHRAHLKADGSVFSFRLLLPSPVLVSLAHFPPFRTPRVPPITLRLRSPLARFAPRKDCVTHACGSFRTRRSALSTPFSFFGSFAAWGGRRE
jgi:hypothetical protein